METSRPTPWLNRKVAFDHTKEIEAETLKTVERDGRDPTCVRDCQSIGKKCPPIWCEKVYQAISLLDRSLE